MCLYESSNFSTIIPTAATATATNSTEQNRLSILNQLQYGSAVGSWERKIEVLHLVVFSYHNTNLAFQLLSVNTETHLYPVGRVPLKIRHSLIGRECSVVTNFDFPIP